MQFILLEFIITSYNEDNWRYVKVIENKIFTITIWKYKKITKYSKGNTLAIKNIQLLFNFLHLEKLNWNKMILSPL